MAKKHYKLGTTAADFFLLEDDLKDVGDISNMIRITRGQSRSRTVGSDYVRSIGQEEDGYDDSDFA